MPIRAQRTAVKRLTAPEIIVRRINREVIEKFNLPPGVNPADPFEFLIRIQAGLWPKDISDNLIAGSDEDKKLEKMGPPLDMRMEAAKIAARMVRPFLTSTELSGPEGGPIEVGATLLNVQEMMKIPGMRSQIEKLSLELSTMRRQKMLTARDTLEAQDTTAVTISSEEEPSNGTASNERPDPDGSGEDGQ